MGIEDDLKEIRKDIDIIKWQLHELIEATRPENRQDTEKRIKDTLSEYEKVAKACKDHTEMGCHVNVENE